jgi:holo-[acyl-carrier protein] synthase
MILGIGTDLCDVARMRKKTSAKDESFARGVFTPGEIAYCRAKHDPAQHFAARFAAKEACLKALSGGGGKGASWLEIEVVNEPGGRPLLELTGMAQELARGMGAARVLVSLTHTKETAAATVLIEG